VATIRTELNGILCRHGRHGQWPVNMRKERTATRRFPSQGAAQQRWIDNGYDEIRLPREVARQRSANLFCRRHMNVTVAHIIG